MTDAENSETLTLSRRRLLRGAAWAAGGGAWLAAVAETAAVTKMSHKIANYRNAPKGKFRCDNCSNWAPPSSCKLVQSPISPTGYCQFHSPK